jgi:hypothetical protein
VPFEVLPSLRLEGSLSDDEREHGVTMAKANARQAQTIP